MVFENLLNNLPKKKKKKMSDEFAELKANQPEFMDELVSTEARGNVPWAHKGEAGHPAMLSLPDQPAIIVMELIPDDWQLIRYTVDGKLPVVPKDSFKKGVYY